MSTHDSRHFVDLRSPVAIMSLRQRVTRPVVAPLSPGYRRMEQGDTGHRSGRLLVSHFRSNSSVVMDRVTLCLSLDVGTPFPLYLRLDVPSISGSLEPHPAPTDWPLATKCYAHFVPPPAPLRY